MKLNLDEVMVQLSLDSDKKVPMALRKEIANAIYQTGRNGLADVALSTKMWNGDKDTDYSDDEVNSIKEFVEKSFVPAVIVAVQKVIEESKS
jgi:hypothetical protein|nr:MAG TPA: hypothetical protein [Caudoviricetes sp.]